jgi:hypothetical protein
MPSPRTRRVRDCRMSGGRVIPQTSFAPTRCGYVPEPETRLVCRAGGRGPGCARGIGRRDARGTGSSRRRGTPVRASSPGPVPVPGRPRAAIDARSYRRSGAAPHRTGRSSASRSRHRIREIPARCRPRSPSHGRARCLAPRPSVHSRSRGCRTHGSCRRQPPTCRVRHVYPSPAESLCRLITDRP